MPVYEIGKKINIEECEVEKLEIVSGEPTSETRERYNKALREMKEIKQIEKLHTTKDKFVRAELIHEIVLQISAFIGYKYNFNFKRIHACADVFIKFLNEALINGNKGTSEDI